jgi:hypothetical protein
MKKIVLSTHTIKPRYSRILKKNFGGHWKYEYPGAWRCDDGKRYVLRYSTGIDEYGDSIGTRYSLYVCGISQDISYLFLDCNLFHFKRKK